MGRRSTLQPRIDTVRFPSSDVCLSTQTRRRHSSRGYSTGTRPDLASSDRRTHTRPAPPADISLAGMRLRVHPRLLWPKSPAVEKRVHPAASRRLGQNQFHLQIQFPPRNRDLGYQQPKFFWSRAVQRPPQLKALQQWRDESDGTRLLRPRWRP